MRQRIASRVLLPSARRRAMQSRVGWRQRERGDDHAVKRRVDLSVAALVEPLALGVAGAGGDRCDAGGAGELGSGREALGAGDLALESLDGDRQSRRRRSSSRTIRTRIDCSARAKRRPIRVPHFFENNAPPGSRSSGQRSCRCQSSVLLPARAAAPASAANRMLSPRLRTSPTPEIETASLKAAAAPCCDVRQRATSRRALTPSNDAQLSLDCSGPGERPDDPDVQCDHEDRPEGVVRDEEEVRDGADDREHDRGDDGPGASGEDAERGEQEQ